MAKTTSITTSTGGNSLVFLIDQDDFGSQNLPLNLTSPKQQIDVWHAGGANPVFIRLPYYLNPLNLDTNTAFVSVSGKRAATNPLLYQAIIALL